MKCCKARGGRSPQPRVMQIDYRAWCFLFIKNPFPSTFTHSRRFETPCPPSTPEAGQAPVGEQDASAKLKPLMSRQQQQTHSVGLKNQTVHASTAATTASRCGKIRRQRRRGQKAAPTNRLHPHLAPPPTSHTRARAHFRLVALAFLAPAAAPSAAPSAAAATGEGAGLLPAFSSV